MSDQVRVRFAPSPTGALHIGGVRTALYNYLFARKTGGKMLLRIEDTDQTRFVEGAENYILEALNWVGITIDEGQSVGGAHAPYRQSERKPIYMEYAKKLLDSGKAYYAFDTSEELDAMRQTFESQGSAFQYNAISRTRLKNSLTLSAEEVEAKLSAGEPYVIRLKVPAKEEIRFKDLIREWVVVHSSAVDDKVLMKSDGMPTYHLANVVDDHLMEISHVIRGEEWLPSAPLHILLYRAFGWEDTMPKFAHLPLLLKPEGNGKLSKRDADLGGFPVFPLEWNDPVSGNVARGFREDGYLKDAVVNFLAFLGWNPGTEQEMFTMDELIEAFSLERISKSGAKFDINKAKWFNQQYLKLQSDEELAKQYLSDVELEKAVKIVHLFKERVTFPQEIVQEAQFLFNAPENYDEAIVSSKWNDDAKKGIVAFKEALPALDNFVAEEIKHLLSAELEKAGIKMGKIMQMLRVAITGVGAGPDLMLSMEIMGKTEVLARLEKAVSTLGV
ncbi:glutamyl-tRNA synthetase [Pseudarcicella hirudinis]|uniref:Glutamate--tRNA ligase n=1 Tax=Pseudarcicella hirudinis TaxID=1079859 RepID=A0A1I5Z1W5_9BACT|nr:glutamate--tRNA ligase [Pseudarcicella hirudinis]SFQ50486.1 glutamyl-tRNA synthetase [Pseudarcicella hirudinis]